MLFGEKIANSAGCRSGVVHQNINVPSAVSASLTKHGRLSQISRYRDDFAVCLASNLRGRCPERLLATRADRDIDTLASQVKGDRLANPALPPVTSAVFPFIWRSMKLPSGSTQR
jgi:hypothetical protein